ncbi:inner membrane protein [Algoriphagus boseongensis]|uniref:Inner membrane protein n=1 Tax=Algoriphagus boseongensis TaxID=1442587 RepID=A0A4R6T5S1_9BACT|nr:cell envelope integrity protein CreD [Algoriphagus boseongensis]TDQ16659.1 inner membrane protein [Algoriphagus boseongensis]
MNTFEKPTPIQNQRSFTDTPSFKLIVIGIIAGLLLIPKSFILDLIDERYVRLQDTEMEIQSKWSNEQTLIGPYLKISFWENVEYLDGKEKKSKKEKKHAFFLPENLEIKGNLLSESLHRGIFEVPVYTNSISLVGKFPELPLEKLKILPEQVIWDESKLFLQISDLRGLVGTPEFQVSEELLEMEPFFNSNTGEEGIQLSIPSEYVNSGLSFVGNLSLRGSKNFFATPLGKNTKMSLKGNWNSPSFQGEYLPESRTISENGFESSWQVSHLNRPFGQEFLGNFPDFSGSGFGVTLSVPNDQYQQNIRTAKYALLIIVLSFLALYMMELFTKKSIHPVQYTLVGFALVIYYVLLIAFSEHLGFGLAYLIASVATTLLLGFYSKTIFKKTNQTILFSSILGAFYAFIFIIIKQEDFALLLGSIGLFIALAITMYLSRNINWEKGNMSELNSQTSRS